MIAGKIRATLVHGRRHALRDAEGMRRVGRFPEQRRARIGGRVGTDGKVHHVIAQIQRILGKRVFRA